MAGWGARAWKTGQQSATARNSATPVDSGAPPLTMKRTRPPKPARKRLNRSQSSIGEACASARLGAYHQEEDMHSFATRVCADVRTLQRTPAVDARALAFRLQSRMSTHLQIY